jgi:uncharacterized RDD family membrane protein YckC
VPAPEKLTIDTPEQIALEFPLAGVGSRFLAIAFDTLLQGGAIVALVALGFAVRAVSGFVPPLSGLGMWGIAILLAIGFVIYSGYFAIFEAVWAGQTPGKRLVRLRVIDVSGRPLTVYAAIVRNLLRLVDQLPGMYALGILSILITTRQQRIGDLAAGTVVVHERIDAPVAIPTIAPGQQRFGAHRLRPEEIAVVEEFLRRRVDLGEWTRRQTARRIADRMKQRIGITSAEDDERLLEQLAADYRSSDSYR